MCLLVGFLHAACADVRIDLRRRQALVAQKFLDASQIRAPIEQVRCEAVPQRVRCRLSVEAGQHQIFIQHPPDAARREPFAELIQEKRIAVLVLRIELPNFQPFIERFDRVLAQWADTFFTALSDDS